MLATLADAPLCDPEPRLRAEVRRHSRAHHRDAGRARARRRGGDRIARWATTRRRSFPRSCAALADWGARAARRPLLDGEIVALDEGGPAGRISAACRTACTCRAARDIARRAAASPVAFVAFDLLRDGGRGSLPAAADRAAASAGGRARSRRAAGGRLRLATQVRGDGAALMAEAARARLGGPGRQGRALDVPARAALGRMAQAEAGQPAGVRGRRLHRAARLAGWLRGVAAGRADGRRAPALRRPRRRRILRRGARAGRAPARGARDGGLSVRDRARRPTSGRTGCVRAGRRGAVLATGPTTAILREPIYPGPARRRRPAAEVRVEVASATHDSSVGPRSTAKARSRQRSADAADRRAGAHSRATLEALGERGGGRLAAARRRRAAARRISSKRAVADARTHEGGPVSLLRRRRAVPAAGGARSAAGHEALPDGIDGPPSTSTARPRRPARRARASASRATTSRRGSSAATWRRCSTWPSSR